MDIKTSEINYCINVGFHVNGSYNSSQPQQGVLVSVLYTSGAKFLKRNQSLYRSKKFILLQFILVLVHVQVPV